jgi:hypothetical protein
VGNKTIIHFLLIAPLFFLLCGSPKIYTMEWEPFINSVDNKTIRFVTFRPPESHFATLERQVRVIGPDSVLDLIRNADLSLLPSLIELLKDSKKAWASEIILTALTAGDGKILESFSDAPGQWWKSIGINSHQKWNSWYLANKNKIVWDEELKVFRMTDSK